MKPIRLSLIHKHTDCCEHLPQINPDTICVVESDMFAGSGSHGIMIARKADIPWDSLQLYHDSKGEYFVWYAANQTHIN